jgi:hypothetical protein
MINRKEDRMNFVGSAIFIVFFFFFVCGYSNESAKPLNNNIGQHELITSLHSNGVAANISLQPPTYQKSQISLIDRMSFKFFNEHFKILQDNRSLNQKFSLLKKIQLIIKPIALLRFYSPQLYIDTEVLPILS